MAAGLALTVGLNAVDPKHYAGWSGTLNACEADAHDMADLARSRKFKVTTLLTKKATRLQVSREIMKAANKLKKGDIFMLTYSGHGGQLPDLNDQEPDGQDETWCLYDRQLVDDELYEMLTSFRPGVRVLVFSDSCHSGSMTRLAHFGGPMKEQGGSFPSMAAQCRAMPHEIALRTYQQNKAEYDPTLERKDLKNAEEKVKASVLLISGCQDNQSSSDGDFNGLFTGTLLRVWNHGKFKKGYKAFHKAIVQRMPADQTPNYYRVGTQDGTFEGQQPFTV